MNMRSYTNGRSVVGIGLLGFGVLLLLGNFGIMGGVGAGLWGGLVLGLLSAGFWAVYLSRPLHWWAIIPGGVLGSLAVTALAGTLLPFLPTGALFLFGLSATFMLVRLLGRQPWALIPAGVLAIIATITFVGSLGRWLFPIALIGLGVLLFTRNQRNN